MNLTSTPELMPISSISVLDGRVICLRDLHSSKLNSPTNVNGDEKLTCVNSAHPLKQYIPIWDTDGGTTIFFNKMHFSNELSPIIFKDEGNVIQSNE